MSQLRGLPDQARLELQEIVGDRFVKSDAALLTAYTWQSAAGQVPGDCRHGDSSPLAVVMPASTEQVAAAVQCCLRHGLSDLSHVAGGGMRRLELSSDTVVIDLCRMSALEIDSGNRMAIISAGVTTGVLQAEALKHGLTCHISHSGPAQSTLADIAWMGGGGLTSQGTSMGARNLLAWEWVSPQGEIVRGGSLGSGAGWFGSDGPGPGVRGMICGHVHGAGGLGVFTRIGLKLYPVPFRGPLRDTGQLPQLGCRIPEHAGFFHAVWPDWKSHRAAALDLADEDLCFAMLRMPPDHIGWTLTSTNAEYVQRVRAGTLPAPAQPQNGKSWTLLTLARSEAEHAWRVSAVRGIVERHGGKLLALAANEAQVLYRNVFTSQYASRIFRPSGAATTSLGVLDSLHVLPDLMRASEERTKNGPIFGVGNEALRVWMLEGRYLEADNSLGYDLSSRRSRIRAIRAMLVGLPLRRRAPIGVFLLGGRRLRALRRDEESAHQDYVRAIALRLGGANAFQSSGILPPNARRWLRRAWPVLQPILMSAPMLNLISHVLAKRGF